MKMIGAAEFKKHCLRILDEVKATGEPVTITKRGKPVGVLRPDRSDMAGGSDGIIGALAGSVLRYDRPFDPVLKNSEIDALADTAD